MKKILSGIVLYNPNIKRLKDNIDHIYKQVDKLLLIDNASNNINDINSLITKYKDVEIIYINKNKGVATALKQIMDYAINNSYDYVLSLDQDSVCNGNLINEYFKYIDLDNWGMLTCNILDRNYKGNNTNFDNNYREVTKCITSGSFTNVEAYKKSDGYDEKIFIDGVDFDICSNLRKHKYKIYKINYNGLIHEIGHGKNIKFLGKKYTTFNEPPFRQYYIARNRFYLSKKYPNDYPKLESIKREIKEELLILFFEDNKFKKLSRRWKGIKDRKL